MRSSSRWLVLVGLFLAILLPSSGLAQANGVIQGSVVNGTSGGPEIGAGMAVTLHTLQGDADLGTQEATTDAAGKFRFEGLDTDPTLEYWLEATYLDVVYSSASPYQFGGDLSEINATLSVYETTTDGSTITLNSVHMIAESFGQALRISEIHLYGNTGDRTYIGSAGDSGQTGTISIPIPSDAVGLAFQDAVDEGRYVDIPGGLLDTEPVTPGPESSMAFFSYHLMVADETVALERQFAYPVGTVSVLVAQPGLTLSSPQLASMGSQLFQGRQYEFYSAMAYKADTPMLLEFVPQPDATGGQTMPSSPGSTTQSVAGGIANSSQTLLLWLGVGLAALAVVGGVVYPLAAKRPAAASSQVPDLMASKRKRHLLAELVDLNDELESGELDEETYVSRRAQIVQELKTS